MQTEHHPSRPVGLIPNSRFPLLHHRDAVPGGGAEALSALFRRNDWLNNWRYPGVYEYAHFHSTTHEVLGCAAGWMELSLFGDGTVLRVETGDVLVLPAGVSHEMTGHSDDIMMVGGYPGGADWDNIQGAHLTKATFREAVKRIMTLQVPARDPVTGEAMEAWRDAPSSDRKSTRLNSSHITRSRMPSSA